MFRGAIHFFYTIYEILCKLIAALLLASIWCKKDIKQWLAELPFDVEMLNDVVRTLLAHYELLRTFDEKREIPLILARTPRPNVASSVSALIPYAVLVLNPQCKVCRVRMRI